MSAWLNHIRLIIEANRIGALLKISSPVHNACCNIGPDTRLRSIRSICCLSDDVSASCILIFSSNNMTSLAAIAISISLEIVARLVIEDPNKYDI